MSAHLTFDNLVERYADEIFAYLWRLVQAPQDAEDCLQDAFLRAYRAYPGLSSSPDTAGPPNHRAWLYRIATNTALTHLKRQARTRAHTTDLDPRLAAAVLPVPDLVQNRLHLAEVRQAVESLPAKQRAALLMRKYQDLSYTEIAAALEISESASRANVYQALKKLRAQFSRVTEIQPQETVD